LSRVILQQFEIIGDESNDIFENISSPINLNDSIVDLEHNNKDDIRSGNDPSYPDKVIVDEYGINTLPFDYEMNIEEAVVIGNGINTLPDDCEEGVNDKIIFNGHGINTLPVEYNMSIETEEDIVKGHGINTLPDGCKNKIYDHIIFNEHGINTLPVEYNMNNIVDEVIVNGHGIKTLPNDRTEDVNGNTKGYEINALPNEYSHNMLMQTDMTVQLSEEGKYNDNTDLSQHADESESPKRTKRENDDLLAREENCILDPFLIRMIGEHGREVELDYESLSDDFSGGSDDLSGGSDDEILHNDTIIYGEDKNITSDEMNSMVINKAISHSNYNKAIQRRMRAKNPTSELMSEESLRQSKGKVKAKKRGSNNHSVENRSVEKGKAAKALLLRKKK